MIEIYVDTSEYLDLKLYQGDVRVNADPTTVAITVTDRDTGATVGSATNIPASEIDVNGKETYSYLIDLDVTTTPRNLKAVWTFNIGAKSGQKVESIEVVVPYTTPEEIRSAHSALKDAPVDDLKEMERRVRHIIDNYCNQSFDFADDKTMSIIASGGNFLSLPDRLRRLEHVKRGETYLFKRDVNGDVEIDLVEFNEDMPFLITKKDYGQFTYDIKSDYTSLSSGYPFKSGAIYEVKGDFGWEYVPNEINLAATLLVGEYFCSDSTYRRKNIWWAKTETFEMRFNKELLYTTGNVDVDLLLMDYVANNVELF